MLSYCHGGSESKLDAERIMGAWLAENVDHAGGRPPKPSQRARVLPDWVDDFSQSSRWQSMATTEPLGETPHRKIALTWTSDHD